MYRTKTVKDTSADRDEWVRTMHQGTNPELDGADTVMVWGNGFEGAEQMYADLCWKLDNGFTDEDDPDADRRARTTTFRTRGISRWTALRARS